MPDADRRIFDYFAANAETAQEVDYLAYASYAFAKFEWFEKYVDRHGVEPDQAEIDRWVAELPDSRLDEIHDTASRVFHSAASLYMAERMEQARVQAVLDSIDTEIRRHNAALERTVRSATSFRENLLPNIGAGILSSVIFSIVIILASLIFTRDPSPIAIYKSMTAPGPAAP